MTEDDLKQMMAFQNLGVEALNHLRDGLEELLGESPRRADMQTTVAMMIETFIKQLTKDDDVRREIAMDFVMPINERFGLGLDVPTIDELIREMANEYPVV